MRFFYFPFMGGRIRYNVRNTFKRPKSKSAKNNFRFEFVNWSQPKLDELRLWLEGNKDTLEQTLENMSNRGWKLSISENQRSGRHMVSISDKWGRPGCTNVSYGFEHTNLVSAILGAVYYATEVIDLGDGGDEQETDDDLW
ncbi:MAG: hypothetical protein [Circular genetic element sp.]|nr:MAG: hypothetical protein [Circular genetic element sp.]